MNEKNDGHTINPAIAEVVKAFNRTVDSSKRGEAAHTANITILAEKLSNAPPEVAAVIFTSLSE